MCFATFTIQLGILLGKYAETVNNETPIFIGDPLINLARVVSSFIMHLTLYPEVKISMQMIHYAVFNREKFLQRSAFFPIFIATAKMIGALSA